MSPAAGLSRRLPDRADPARALRQLHEVERAGRAVLRSGRAGRPRQLLRAAARGRLDPQELRVLGAQQLLLRALRRSDPDRPRALPRADRQPETAARQGLLPDRVLHAVGVELDRHRVHLPVPVPTGRCDQHDPVGLRRRRSAVVQQRRGDLPRVRRARRDRRGAGLPRRPRVHGDGLVGLAERPVVDDGRHHRPRHLDRRQGRSC